ncbi:uncharacterized protein yc1106_05577 [Curvularia clavata]|uniref:Arrestin C-terminal-like domain-containing protein n=1 Tax=Curvularia clavata TaxID=95742 RepID=A0A9Q8ZDK0_CURCL|nr:uncharacterized protein yc1106_05577 [Curvularia clavata]
MATNQINELGAHSVVFPLVKPRPLSDIGEVTESSITDTLPANIPVDTLPRSLSCSGMSPGPSSVSRRCHDDDDVRHGTDTVPSKKNSFESSGLGCIRRGRPSRTPSPPNLVDHITKSNIHCVSASNVPLRSSSRSRPHSTSRVQQAPRKPLTDTAQNTAATSFNSTQIGLPSPLKDKTNIIPNHGQPQSPVRHIAARFDPIAHDTNRRIPSRTFIREHPSKQLLDVISYRHPRIQLGLCLSAGIFVGGGSIEGTVQINIDDAERVRYRRTLGVARISVDLLGVEETSGNRRALFLNLATELIDEENPPPQSMVDTQEPIGSEDPFWHLMPSVTNLAFNLSLPLDVGPPPFYSKNARIRYLLCASIVIHDRDKRHVVSTSEDVTVLSVYDPEKALMSLPSPLTASDEWTKPRETTVEVVRVTAGLHRQVWVSGTNIYVDVHIVNNSHKTVKKIELQLERDILCYKHAAASTIEKSAGQARILDTNERSTLSKVTVKQSSPGWHGVAPCQTHLRTCDLEIPRGHATVKCGRKLVTIQLPIVLIHMNSLDLVPNSVAQVAMAIEEKRTARASPSRLGCRPSQNIQGCAFAAPRMQSLQRNRDRDETIQELGQALEQSPRKYKLRRANSNFDHCKPSYSRNDRVLVDGETVDPQDRLRRIQSNDTVIIRPLPRPRVSSATSRQGAESALGFREAEIYGDVETGNLGASSDVSLQDRFERITNRPYRFGKSRSFEKWKDVASTGVGWFKGGQLRG